MSSFRKADRAKVPLKIMMEGVTGSGKTWSALVVAQGIAKKPENVFLIDSEQGRGELYSHLYDYQYARVEVPHQPSKYVALIKEAVAAGAEVIILDSITHAWKFILEYKDLLDAKPNSNRWANWGKVKPLFDELKNAIIQCPIHIIVTTRSKTEYMQQGTGDSARIVKQGTAAILEPEAEYDFMLVLTIDRTHQATASKDNTGLFDHMPPKVLTVDDGRNCLKWVDQGKGDYAPTEAWNSLGQNPDATSAEQEAAKMGVTGKVEEHGVLEPGDPTTQPRQAARPKAEPVNNELGWKPNAYPSDNNLNQKPTPAQPKMIVNTAKKHGGDDSISVQTLVNLVGTAVGIPSDKLESFGAYKTTIEFLSSGSDQIDKYVNLATGVEA